MFFLSKSKPDIPPKFGSTDIRLRTKKMGSWEPGDKRDSIKPSIDESHITREGGDLVVGKTMANEVDHITINTETNNDVASNSDVPETDTDVDRIEHKEANRPEYERNV